jgi:hypothetical protein
VKISELDAAYAALDEMVQQRDEARRIACELEARIIVLEEDRRETSNKFGTNPCSEIILPDYPLARDPKEIAKRRGWDCFTTEVTMEERNAALDRIAEFDQENGLL